MRHRRKWKHLPLRATAFLFLLIVSTQSRQAEIQAQTTHTSPKHSATSASPQEEIDETEVVRVTTNLVTVPVSVMDRSGRYIMDLRQEDFRIYENGAEQQIAHFSTVEQPFFVVLLMDTSTSTTFYLDAIKEIANTFVNQLRPEDSVLPISFSGNIRALIPEGTSDRTFLRMAINNMRTDAENSGTRLYDAVDYANQILRSTPGRKAIILFTDGEDTWSKATLKGTLRNATELDALIYTIHYGSSPSAKYLLSLADKTGGRFYQATNMEMIKESFTAIAEELRRQYSIGYYPKAAVRSGGQRQIKVRVNRSQVEIRTRKSYTYEPSSKR